jgi:hypothetical protein
MAARRRSILIGLAVVLLLSAYPGFVLAYTWHHVLRSDLPGGRHGPLDAYRHTLASAVVAYTLAPHMVEWVTAVMDNGPKASSAMDRHNNRIGAAVGSRAVSFGEVEPAVRAQVLRGTVNASDPEQTTWLPQGLWRRSRFW